ncbi:MAG: cation diffusion facilitator family transporter [Candidatus Omnitrophota bacterium]
MEKHIIKQQQALAAKISIAGSITLFFIAAIVGIAVDSVTLLLDASSNLVILVVGFLMHFVVKKLHKPPDERFNFGYEKYEPLTVLVQGGLIMATCIISVMFAVQDIIHADDIKNYYFPAIGTFLSGIIGIFIFNYFKIVARGTKSSMMQAAALHWLTDTLMSFGIFGGFFIGLLLHYFGYLRITPYIDPVMAIILALFLVRMPAKVMINSISELLDAVPAKDICEEVKNIARKYKPQSCDIHRVRIRKAGGKLFVDIGLVLKSDLIRPDITKMINAFEHNFKTRFTGCDLVIYLKEVNDSVF